MKKNFYLVLHNIRSLHNAGSCFRTADGARVNKIFLTGYTGAPQDMFGRTEKTIAKVALGAEKSIAWERARNISSLITRLKKENIFIIALEQSPSSIDYQKLFVKHGIEIKKSSGIALIVGNEVRGINNQILKKCDAVIEIPMHGKKESLNVAVAAGIAIFELKDNF